MRYEHIIRAFQNTPWALMPEKLAEITAFLELKADGGEVDPETVRAIVAAAERPTAQTPGNIAVLPLYGVLSQRASMVTESSGGTSIEKFTQAYRAALAEDSIRAIVLDVDSPGGSVAGTDELAQELLATRHMDGGPKPVVAVANSLMASAAYWVSACVDEIVASPGAQVGSIGVLAAHVDESKAEELAGVKTTVISAGKYKAEGIPTMPLSDTARRHAQEMIDSYYDTFVRRVAQGRHVDNVAVREGFGQGRVVRADQARALGMVDRIATLDATIIRFGGRGRIASLPLRQARAELASTRGIGAGDEFEEYDVLGAAMSAAGELVVVVAGPIGRHSTATSEGAWDGPANEARLNADGTETYYRRAYAWQDPEGDPATKAAYRFIHHEVSGDGNIGAANMTACSTGIGVLNGGRGGTTIPTGDKQGVYNHLAGHLRDGGREPPALAEHSQRDREDWYRRAMIGV